MYHIVSHESASIHSPNLPLSLPPFLSPLPPPLLQVLPVLWLYHHVAHKVCRDLAHTALSKVFKLQAMIQLSLFDQAVQILSELLVGAGLPSVTTDHQRLVESHWVSQATTRPEMLKLIPCTAKFWVMFCTYMYTYSI